MGAPGHHHRVKKLDFHCTVVQNRVSSFSRLGASGSGFGGQNGAKMEVEINKKVSKNTPRKSLRNYNPKVSQNGAKMNPKRDQKGTKIALIFRLGFVQFFANFRVPAARPFRGSAGGWRRPLGAR